jgi:hypothetical protein
MWVDFFCRFEKKQMEEKFSNESEEIKRLLEESKIRMQEKINEFELKIKENSLRILELEDPNSVPKLQIKVMKTYFFTTLGLIIALIFLIFTFRTDKTVINFFACVFISIYSGFYLWFLRKKLRLLYGIIEFIVGVVAVIVVLRSINYSYELLVLPIEKMMSFVGGLYIMVRGIDNCFQSEKGKKWDVL